MGSYRGFLKPPKTMFLRNFKLNNHNTHKINSCCGEDVEKHGTYAQSIRPRDVVVLRVHHPVPAVSLSSKNGHSQKEEKS